MASKEKKSNAGHKVLSVIGIILCIILIPILTINVTLLAKSVINKSEVPTVGNVFPLVVLTASMEPEINGGDLIICHTIDAADVKEGDIISFYDPQGNGTSVVTHRVVAVNNDDGVLSFRTRGDANNTEDRLPVPADSVIGIYIKSVPHAGNVAMFMQTTPGLIVCVLTAAAHLICPVVKSAVILQNMPVVFM